MSKRKEIFLDILNDRELIPASTIPMSALTLGGRLLARHLHKRGHVVIFSFAGCQSVAAAGSSVAVNAQAMDMAVPR